MPNPNFTPLSHEELGELWDRIPNELSYEQPRLRRLILTAIWWEAMWYFTGSSIHDDKQKQDWFLAKLREIGID